ncbi:pyruvate/2-oxoglutarate dehydrogenase complex dihydrolipoamide dehydrogenase (E3) component [Breoghania corrubedonensis]|uniref:Pyruvate/2-oxoglutarate dehydrogenase complex dihydrolipoamide dehydrogenase (E3) component n=1 Tax=Breoghania corrubedonensis TaxID=665038 RepID=A0A2T5VFQ4_9HYPH|nr:NAD(P)/FAD-dependent oxidoreductase [Breoghania corrubedonensis]PTW62580.1 pyruvate/2-oxoglutarate dehydrogenase complex dihydrolipoamide dehydrogenase (E3) component [Breoghania corrubedonensis]
MAATCDVIVVGAGPAGAEAAMECARHGLDVVLIDEAPDAGGQVYRATPKGFRTQGPREPEAEIGDDLRKRLADSSVRCRFDTLLWSIAPGYRADLLGPDGPSSEEAPIVVIANGARERVVPFPGWTLPGVIGLAGATVMLKSQKVLPGRQTLVAGAGPLLLAVATTLRKAGGEVAGVIDLASRREWLATVPATISRPDLLARGIGWTSRLTLAGVPMRYRQAIRRIEQAEAGKLRAFVGPVYATGAPVAGTVREFVVDAVAVGNGLAPASEVTRLLRAEHVYDTVQKAWVPQLDEDFRTSLPGLFVVGDGAGISGAAAAAIDGRRVGLSIAFDADRLSADNYRAQKRTLSTGAKKARRFGQAMARLMAPRSGQIAAIAADAVVCRCEDVTRAELDAAVADGATSPNQVKAWTRCGMGPCQGRTCGDIASALAAAALGQEAPPAPMTGRSPLRPLPLGVLAGDIDYDDLELPPPAPL